MLVIGDLRETKKILDIDQADSTEDTKLLFLIEQASSIIEEFCGGRDFSYKTRTQYYKSPGTRKLLLRNRPVYPNASAPFSPIQIVYDSAGSFGSAPGAFTTSATATPYVYGVDYALQIDMDDGGSRSGIVFRINELWTKPVFRQTGLLSPFVDDDAGSLRVTYTAGFSVDTLPAVFRAACNLLVAKLRYILPLGVEMGSESYEERSIALVTEQKNYLMSLVKPLLFSHRNWTF